MGFRTRKYRVSLQSSVLRRLHTKLGKPGLLGCGEPRGPRSRCPRVGGKPSFCKCHSAACRGLKVVLPGPLGVSSLGPSPTAMARTALQWHHWQRPSEDFPLWTTTVSWGFRSGTLVRTVWQNVCERSAGSPGLRLTHLEDRTGDAAPGMGSQRQTREAAQGTWARPLSGSPTEAALWRPEMSFLWSN